MLISGSVPPFPLNRLVSCANEYQEEKLKFSICERLRSAAGRFQNLMNDSLDTQSIARTVIEIKFDLFSSLSEQDVLGSDLTITHRILKKAEKFFHKREFLDIYGKAYAKLSLQTFHNDEEIRRSYALLFCLIPCLTIEQFVGDRFAGIHAIHLLLASSSHFAEEQKKLAIVIAERYLQHALKEETPLNSALDQLVIAANYFGKALKIIEKHNLHGEEETHKKASKIFSAVIQILLIKSEEFQQQLDVARRKDNPELFEKTVAQIEELKKYCIDNQDREVLYNLYIIAEKEFGQVGLDHRQRYDGSRERIQNGLNGARELNLASTYPTQKYQQQLKALRNDFAEKLKKECDYKNIESVQKFQIEMTQRLVSLVNEVVLVDVFSFIAFFNPLPFDLRATGSIARLEFCPYSDLECFILTSGNTKAEIKAQAQIFSHAAYLLDLFFALFAETAGIFPPYPIFTALGPKNPSGLHLDGNPSHSHLIDSPSQMALHQKPKDDPVQVNDSQNIILTSISLKGNDPSLFETFEREMRNNLPELGRHQRALERMKEHAKDFQKCWSEPFGELLSLDLKKHYSELFHQLISDLSLYFGIKSTNTLDRIDELLKLKVFSEESGILLKEAATSIWLMRVDLHLRSGEQKEVFETDAIADHRLAYALRQTYWMVLLPLYTHLRESGIFQNQKSLTNLIPIDLHEIAFQLVNRQGWHKEILPLFVASLAEANTNPERLLHFYDKILKDPSFSDGVSLLLRRAYTNALQKFPIQKGTLTKILHHPDATGLREAQTFAKCKFDELFGQISSQEKPKGGFCFVKIKSRFGDHFFNPSVVDAIIDRRDFHLLRNADPRAVFFPVSDSLNFYFRQQSKENPRSFAPAKTQAANSLMWRLFGHGGCLHSELAHFTMMDPRNPSKILAEYFVCISLVCKGVALSGASEEDLCQLDKKRLSQLFLASPLILSGDLREGNCWIVKTENEKGEPIKQLIVLNQDQSWMDPVTKEDRSGKSLRIHFHNELFLRFPKFALDREAIQEFLNLKPDLLLKEWLSDLCLLNRRIEHTSPKFKPFSFLFEKGVGSQLLTIFHGIQKYLASHSHDAIFATEVLQAISNRHACNMGPTLYQSYEEAKQLSGTLPQKMHHIKGRFMTHTNPQASPQSISKSDEQKQYCKPETALKEIESLVCHDSGFLIFQDEEGAISEKSFEGIDSEVQRMILDTMKMRSYKRLNLSHCGSLEMNDVEVFLRKSGAKLVYLDLRHCLKVTEDCFKLITQYCPSLKELYIGSPKMNKVLIRPKFLGKTTPLTFPALEHFDISACPSLSDIKIQAPLLKVLHANQNPKLVLVEVQSQFEVTTSFINSPTKYLYKPMKPHRPANRSIAEKPLDSSKSEQTQMDCWLEELQKNSPHILRTIRSRDKSNYASSMAYVESLISPRIKSDASQQNLLNGFRDYLVAKSERLPDMVPDPTTLLKEQQEVAADQRRFFVADSHDYAAAIPVALLEIPESPPIPEELEVGEKIEKILSHIKNAQKAVELVRQRDAIFFVGNTGSGKSTNINYLSGCKMFPVTVKHRECIDAENPVAQSGHSCTSETDIPQVFRIAESAHALCDMPGYLETRGSELSIANAVNMRNIIESARSNRILFHIDYYSIQAGRGYLLKESIKVLVDLFGTMEGLNQNMKSVLIGVTRIPRSEIENFENTKGQIADLAEQVDWDGKNWQVSQHCDQIIPLDFLEQSTAPKREDVLKKLISLTPIQQSTIFYQTVLNDQDQLLILSIAKAVSNKINHLWNNWNIEGIAEEFHKLSSLQRIQHPAITQAITALRAQIQEKYTSLGTRINSIAYTNSPEAKREIKAAVQTLKSCCQLNLCFPEENKVTLYYEKIVKKLKNSECKEQMGINNSLEGDLRIVTDRLASSLDNIIKEQSSALASLSLDSDDSLDTFLIRLGSLGISAVEGVLSVFKQMHCEANVRPHKYVFGDQVPPPIEKATGILHELIISAYLKAKITEQKTIFEIVIQSIYGKLEQAVKNHYYELCKTIEVAALQLLSRHGFGEQELNSLHESLFELRALLDKEGYHSYERRVGDLLQKIQAKSLFYAIQDGLNMLQEQDFSKLDQYYANLALLDQSIFEEACSLAKQQLIDQPIQAINRLLSIESQENYSNAMKCLHSRVHSIRQLTACFRDSTAVNRILAEIDNKIEKEETEKRKREMHSIKTLLAENYAQATAKVSGDVIIHFEEYSRLALEHTRVDRCLLQLQGLSEVVRFHEVWQNLAQAIDSQTERYFTPQNDDLSSTQEEYKAKLSDYFRGLDKTAQALKLKNRIDQLVLQWENIENQEIPDADHTAELQETLATLLAELKSMVSTDAALSSVRQIWKEMEQVVQVHLLKMEKQSQHRTGKTIYEKIEKLLASDLTEEGLPELNECYASLALLDRQKFDAACELAERELIQKSQNAFGLLLNNIDANYCAKMEYLRTKLTFILSLPNCFQDVDKAHSIVKKTANFIRSQEGLRRDAEVNSLKSALIQSFDVAQARLTAFTHQNPDVIANLLSNNSMKLEGQLKELSQCVEEIHSYYMHWLKLNEALQTQEQTYYCQKYKQDDLLLKLQADQKNILITWLSATKRLARALQLGREIDLLLTQVDQEARAIIKNSPKASIYQDILRLPQLSFIINYIGELEELAKNESQLVSEIHQNYAAKLAKQNSETDIAVRKKMVESTVQELESACIQREFLPILDQIPETLSWLQEESPESYENSKKFLLANLNAWKDSNELTKTLQTENYTDVINMLTVFKTLSKTLAPHQINFDVQEMINTIYSHINDLHRKAEQEISCNPTHSQFFGTRHLKNFLEVLRTFEKQNLHGDHRKNFLTAMSDTVVKRWKNWIQIHPPQFASPRSRDKRLAPDSIFAREVIKQHNVATQLSLLPHFGTAVKSLFSKLSQEAIYKIGVELAGFIDNSSYPSTVSASAKATIDMFPEFRLINNEWFNRKAGGVTFAMALDELRCEPPLQPTQRKCLESAYQRFKQEYTTQLQSIIDGKFHSESHVKRTHALAKQLIPHAKRLSSKAGDTAKLLAYIFAQWTYLNSAGEYHSGDKNTLLQPHNTQILSIFRLIGIDQPDGLQHHLAQVKTGEGKSISLGIVSTLFALLGYDVDVMCYNSYLSHRDQVAFANLFQSFEAAHRIHYCTVDFMINRMMSIHIADFRAVIKGFLRGEKFVSQTRLGGQKRLLLIDEVDVFFGKTFYGKTYSPLVHIDSKSIEQFMRHIWENKKRLCELSNQEAIEELQQTPQYASILTEYPNLDSFLPREVSKMLKALPAFFDSKGKIEHQCIVKERKIGYLDKRTRGINFNVKVGYYTAFANLYYSEKGEVDLSVASSELCIGLTGAEILYSEVVKFYQVMFGLTATLEGLSEGENQILNDYQFNIRSFVPSTFNKKELDNRGAEVKSGKREEEYFQLIRKEIEAVIQDNRASLVVFKNIEQLNLFENYLTKQQKNISRYTTPEILHESLLDSEKSAVVGRAIAQFKTTLITRAFGRGTDFVCRDSGLVTNGGVHVILTFYPKTLTEEMQIRGRTCRQDDPGSIKKIIFADDLLKQKLVPPKDDDSALPDLSNSGCVMQEDGTFVENWDRFLEEKRSSVLDVSRRKSIEDNLAHFTPAHVNSMKLLESIEQNRVEDAIGLLHILQRP